MRALKPIFTAFGASFVLAGCTETESALCDQGLLRFEGACVDPVRRYEPDRQIDQDNVVAYGDPLTQLQLPPPPKSGFRIVAPPRLVGPGEEVAFCLSWPIPDLTHQVVHAARVYTTAGLHHSNVIAKPVATDLGPNPYPDCHPGAADPIANIGAGIPDVLFANSTQVVGRETIAFPNGMGYVLDDTREIATDIHFLNPSTESNIVEVVYDFFTMPPDKLEQEIAPFVVDIQEFSVPPHTSAVVGTTCKVFGGNVTMIMPHTHDLAQRFTVDKLPPEGQAGPTRIFDDGPFDLQSDIVAYDPPISLDDAETIHHECTFANVHDFEVHYGLGKNEMCTLFGYVYPPEKQFAGRVTELNGACNSIQLGLFR